jgi:soluble lytic murein transglycosylase
MAGHNLRKAKQLKTCSSVYGRARSRLAALASSVLVSLGAIAPCVPAHAQPAPDPVADAREAFRKKDRNRLAAARAAALSSQHPLAM